ncbi:MAG: 4Fe-4S binding protein [Candidatus Nezhaarchaeota archaeon]|nr:4Fe-4S binding protein [Candidatus Nezhaarchaeota archaeon]
MQTLKPTLEVEVVEDKAISYKWKGPVLEKKLVYNLDKCFGCGLCEIVCPVKAISMGPIKEIASGRIRAPYIIIDETKCIVCPLCSSICPSGALNLELRSDFEYPRVKGCIVVDKKKCIPCLLCEKVCPRKAIKANVSVKKKRELVKYLEEGNAWGRGRISIDVDKCCFCGLCELLCDAIKIERITPQPPNFKPGISIRVDEEKCDYCGLCERICPVKAIEVECTESAPREVKEPVVEGSIRVNEDCVWCGLCSSLCPVKAIEVEKTFEGDVYMIEPNDCDPSGCKNCINICPVKIVYVAKPPSKEKMLFAKDYCIFCGSCEKSCPVDAIRVIRRSMRIESSKSPWIDMSFEQFRKVLYGYKHPKLSIYHRVVKLEETPIALPQPLTTPPTPKGFSKVVEGVERIERLLSSALGRILFERHEVKRLLSNLRGEQSG